MLLRGFASADRFRFVRPVDRWNFLSFRPNRFDDDQQSAQSVSRRHSLEFRRPRLRLAAPRVRFDPRENFFRHALGSSRFPFEFRLEVFLQIFLTALNLLVLVPTIVYQTTIWSKFDRTLIRSLRENPLETSNSLDHFQEKYSCCGVSGPNDYEKLPLDPLPLSCCRLPNCWRDTTISLMHPTGCSSSMAKFLRTELSVLIGVAAFCSLADFFLVVLMFSVRFE